MCCPAGEHINIEGEKNFLQAAFPPSQPPLHPEFTWRQGGRGRRGVNRNGRRGKAMQIADMEKILSSISSIVYIMTKKMLKINSCS